MIKVILPGAYDWGMPAASLINIHSRGVDRDWMSKRASIFTKEIAGIKPRKGHSYIHLISLGAQEFYGPNRNGDGFNEKQASFELLDPKPGIPKVIQMAGGLVKFHRTFTKHAHVFDHHRNDDPAHRSGDVTHDCYNEPMHRGELIICVPNDKWEDELQKLASGESIPYSMACRVPYDICSICGNRAPNRDAYCDHLKQSLTQILKEGNQIFAINDCPAFFDISRVFKPADRIAWSLEKVASAPAGTISSAEVAEMMGISAPPTVLIEEGPRGLAHKIATMQRMAAIEKQIEGEMQPFCQMAGAVPSTPVGAGDLDTLRSAELQPMLNALADASICLPVKDFFRLALGGRFDSVAGEMENVKSLLPGIYGKLSRDDAESVAGDSAYDPASGFIPNEVREIIGQMVGNHSLAEGPARKRIQIAVIRKGSEPKMASVKEASFVPGQGVAPMLAKEYAKYQLSFARTAGGNDLVCGLTVLRNYLQ